MKPQLETIHLRETAASFKFFKRSEPTYEPYWHYHPEIELTFIEKGNGMRMVGDHIASFQDLDLVLLGENLPHNYVTTNIDKSEKNVAHVFQFSKNMLSPFPECRFLNDLFSSAKYGLQFRPTEKIVGKIISFEKLKPVLRLITFLEILNELSSIKNIKKLSGITYSPIHRSDKYSSKISEVTSYILNNYTEPISLEQVARFADMTPNSFCRWFKKSVGNTFVTYLNSLRIEKACQYLWQTDWAISETAYKTGFDNISHFNRTFKKIKNTSPSAFRKGVK